MAKNVSLTVDTRVVQIVITKDNGNPAKAEVKYAIFETSGRIGQVTKEYRPDTLPLAIQTQIENLWTQADTAVRGIEGT